MLYYIKIISQSLWWVSCQIFCSKTYLPQELHLASLRVDPHCARPVHSLFSAAGALEPSPQFPVKIVPLSQTCPSIHLHFISGIRDTIYNMETGFTPIILTNLSHLCHQLIDWKKGSCCGRFTSNSLQYWLKHVSLTQ